MISNNTSYKLKASKGSRNNQDYQDQDDNESVEGDATGDSIYRYQIYSSRDGKYRGTKPRMYEYVKPSRGLERRGGFRGRISSRRSERDYNDGSYIGRFDSGMYPYSKFSEAEKKAEIKFNLPEDTRISKLLRRLSVEEDQENSLQISKKLLEVLLHPDNATYIRKSFNILRDSMLHILLVAPGPLAKRQCARAFGRMGYILAQDVFDFGKYLKVIMRQNLASNEESVCLFMEALKETLELERNEPVLDKERVYHLMRDLIMYIEATDNVEVFKLSLDNLMSCVEFYPNNFCDFFKDTMDLLFGWHVDHTQPLSNIEFISKHLQRISTHFQMNFEFTITLVLHFVEDIETYSNQLVKTDDKNFDNIAMEHITVFILALNTVLKCLKDSPNITRNELFTNKLITDALTQVVSTITDALELVVPDNLIIAGNESVCILLGLLNNKSMALIESILQLVDLELSIMNDLSDASIISMLLMISKVIKELSANLPIELIPKIVGPNSQIVKLRYSPYIDIQQATICIYQALLNLKNIPLLQEAYRFILGDLEVSFNVIVPNATILNTVNPFKTCDYDDSEAELVSLFLLRCLSQLANASGSIIGMWALKPSILELLGVHLQPFRDELALKTPALQYCILYLLYSHCRCYNFFISSSTLVNNKLKIIGCLGLTDHLEDVNKSPNSGNFSIILNIVRKTLCSKINYDVQLLVLHWFKEILIAAETYLEVLYLNKEFMRVTEILINCGYSKNAEVALAVGDSLDRLLSNKQLSWKNNLLIDVNKLCTLHMTSTNSEVRSSYTKLSTNIPWDVTIIEYNKLTLMENMIYKQNSIKKYNIHSISLAQHLHINGTLFGELMTHHFKTLMNYLLKNEIENDNMLEIIFMSCWPLEADNQELSDNYREIALNSQSVLSNWATWEAAQLCVNNKLRTPLGKPNETFTSFETGLKQLARDVMKIKQDDTSSKKHVQQKRVRLLLQFIEHLEMCIYNASEGSAIAIPQPPKPVRTFFSTNALTCREWLSRIRIILVQLALHSGQSVIALRHGQELINDLYNNNKIDGVDFERGVMYLTLSLLNLHESEAIQGLFVWCNSVAKKQYLWIKCAADQANRKYELAAKGYNQIIDDLKEENLDIYIKHFISDQIINCYRELNDWIAIMRYKIGNMNVLLTETENGMRYSFNTVNFECAQSIFNMETITHAFNELTVWGELENRDSWSVYDNLATAEYDLYNIALNIAAPNNEHIINKIDGKLYDIQKIIRENILYMPSEFLQEFCLLNYVGCGLKNVMNNVPASTVFLVSENFENEVSKINSSTLSKILWWSEYFATVQNQGFSSFSSNLRLNIIKKARKESNFSLASSQLYRFMNNKNLLQTKESKTKTSVLIHIAESFKAKIPEISIWTADTAKAVQEIIKLLYDEPNDKRLVFNLCAIASTSISKCADMYGGVELKQISSKILLKLAKWLQSNDQISLTEITSPLGKLLIVLPEIGIENIGNNIIPLNEMVIGKLLQFSVNQCQTLAKTWNAFGTWCYRWGRKIVDNSADLSNTLTNEDRNAIQAIIPTECKPDDMNRILLIMSQTRAYVDEEDIDSNDINTSEMIRSQLKNVPVLFNIPDNIINALVHIWRNLQKRIYAYYEHSVDAYFKYLHLARNSENITKATESNTITVTLRLLRLIVKHALELQNVLEEGLASTPTHPWKVIIPQLFSRLNHPESYVRERVSELLCRVAEDAPHLITFPAVVGALEGGMKFDFSEISLPKDCLSQNNECNDDGELNDLEDTYESDNDESKNVLQACFKSMVDTLSKQAPETITQVQLLVKELRRIILLWDELWLGTLAQHHSEINKRQQQLELEIEKVNLNSHLGPEEKISLITEKHRIIIKPIIFILEQLHDITSVEPETPHEKQFQERYSDAINDILKKLKNPENPDKPQESWKLLKELQNNFQQKAHKRTLLKMQEISPVLANINDTVISMPGQALNTKVHISHVSNQVSILPTKTKPKKLIFHGSDGRTYTYLFKGLEDLHLDERIMQFLSIANTMMAQSSEGTGHNLYRAKHYSVIPLGPRSGLISWVGGTTPVFALYKRWQQRESSKGVKNSSTSSVLRPSELFYSKLNPLLVEHGVKNIENRKEWPLVVLKQVLLELMAETPSNLLAKELWCHSVSPGVWWQMVRKYSYSVAVMSIIGYIIGLGDRHLDNVLVDLNSGEVVHIDYNVCFEKGKTLRVPEKVPFRLTPNIRDALGVTGVEGMFRLACENILRTMKKGRETLLTLLEAFVYDPLVDWTVGNEGLVGTTFGGMSTNTIQRQSRKDLEKEVTLAMYRVRCTEMKIDWSDNKNDILEKIIEIQHLFTEWLQYYDKSTNNEDQLQDLHQQMALIKEAEANGVCKQTLQSLPSRFETYRKTQDALLTAKNDLDKFMHESEVHIERYTEAIKYLQGQQFQQWFIELNANVEKEKVFDLVKEFLQNAGQANMITQCEQSENELSQLLDQQTAMTLKSLNLLQEYWLVYSQCPLSFLENHRIFYYLKWTQMLKSSNDLNTCDHIYEQFFAFNNINTKPINAIMTFSYHLNHLYNNVAAQASKAYEEFNKVRNEESSTFLEKMYADAKVCLMNFLKHEPNAPKALEFVIVSELLLLNRTFLTLETAASKTGDSLIKLTSREGDWFLDELTLSSSKAIELINYLSIHNSIENDEQLMKLMSGLQSANNMYKSLHELHFNFHTIILPESIKKIQSEEVTVAQMISNLESIVLNIGMTLPELVQQLEKHLACVVMEMESSPTHEIIQSKVSHLKLQYQSLLHSPSGILSPGKMLLMGFNGLFDKLNLESNNIVNSLGKLDIPLCWRKLDQVKEAKGLAAPIFNANVHAILDDIFLLKRLQAMYEFFKLCMDMCQSFQGQEPVVVLNDEQLLKPIRKFIADFISRQFLGITTEAIAYVICFLLRRLGLDVTNEIEQKDIGAENKVPLDELYHKGWNMFLKKGIFSQNLLAQTSSVESNLKNAWEKIQEPKKLEKTVTLLQSSVARLQNQITAHNWLFEEILAQQPSNFLRSKFLGELRNKKNSLKIVQLKVIEAREKQKGLIASVAQRLKWAAGANPDLNQILSAFENAISTRDTRLEHEIQISTITLTSCTSILHHEILRSISPESKSYEKIFLACHQKWAAACQYSAIKVDAVTSVEENIMKLYTPDMSQNPNWMNLISGKISETIQNSQKESAENKLHLIKTGEEIIVALDGCRILYSTHCKIMNDFKNLIKSMVKIDECSIKAQQFIIDYRLYIEHFSALFHMKKDALLVEDVHALVKSAKYLECHTNELYGSLLELEGRRGSRPQLVRQEGMALSPLRVPPSKQESMTKGQQRNAYAVGVWRRVRMKLEGRDPDPGRKYTTQEQVDYVIREATSLDNLALLYEGWTPWV